MAQGNIVSNEIYSFELSNYKYFALKMLSISTMFFIF